MLVIYLAPLPRGFLFGLGTLGPFRFSLSGPMLRPAFATSRMNRSKRGHAS